jgi:hypothetical protein
MCKSGIGVRNELVLEVMYISRDENRRGHDYRP